tara:strand:- start:681 stop:839 length:159 start_codon:yes stop_codon:yes gene_type:complete
MAEAKKKEAKKKEVKKVGKLKITKPNGNVIERDLLDGLKEAYVAKGYKVEEM